MSLRKDIDISKTSNLGVFEKAYKKNVLQRAVNAAMNKAAKQAVAILAENTLKAPPAKPGGSGTGAVATRAFLKAWEILPDRPSLSISIINKKIYSPYVEEGVKGGKKLLARGLTLDMFEQWIRARGITSSQTSSSRRLAKMIIWSINKRAGVRFAPRNIVKKSTPKIRGIFRTCIRQELEDQTLKNFK